MKALEIGCEGIVVTNHAGRQVDGAVGSLDMLPEIVEVDRSVHASEHHQLTHSLIPMSSAWLFEQWRTDIIGPFLRVPENVRFVIVAIDYFTKWVEAEPLVSITGNAVQKFLWKNVVCRFSIPKVIVLDNGQQFAENPFKK